MKAGFRGVKIGIVALTVPFLFIFRPELLMQSPHIGQTILYILLTLLAYCVLAAFLNDYGLVKLGNKGLIISGLSSLGIFAFLFTEVYLFLIVGLICTVCFSILQLRDRRKGLSQKMATQKV